MKCRRVCHCSSDLLCVDAMDVSLTLSVGCLDDAATVHAQHTTALELSQAVFPAFIAIDEVRPLHGTAV